MQTNEQITSLELLLNHIESNRKWGIVATPPKIGISTPIQAILEKKKKEQQQRTTVIAKNKKQKPEEVEEEEEVMQSKDEQMAVNLWNANLHKYSNQQEYISRQLMSSSVSQFSNNRKKSFYYMDLEQVFSITDFYLYWTKGRKTNERLPKLNSDELQLLHKSAPIHHIQHMLQDYFLLDGNSGKESKGLIVFDHVSGLFLPILYALFEEISEHLGIVVIPQILIPYIPSDRTTLGPIAGGKIFSNSNNTSLTPIETLPYSLAFVRQLADLCDVLHLLDHLNNDTLFTTSTAEETSSPSHTFNYQRVLIVTQCVADNSTGPLSPQRNLHSPTILALSHLSPSNPSPVLSTSPIKSTLPSPTIAANSQEYEQYSSLVEILSYCPAMQTHSAFAMTHFQARELLNKIQTLRTSAFRFAKGHFAQSVEHQIEWQYRLYYLWYSEVYQRVFEEASLLGVSDSEVDDSAVGQKKAVLGHSMQYLLHMIISKSTLNEPKICFCPHALVKHLDKQACGANVLWEHLIGSGLLEPCEPRKGESIPKGDLLQYWYYIPTNLLPFLQYHLTKTVAVWSHPVHLQDISESNKEQSMEARAKELLDQHMITKTSEEMLMYALLQVLQSGFLVNEVAFDYQMIFTIDLAHNNYRLPLDYLIQSLHYVKDIASEELQVMVALVLLATARDYLFVAFPMNTQMQLLTQILLVIERQDILQVVRGFLSTMPSSTSINESEDKKIDQMAARLVLLSVQYLLQIGHTLAFTSTSITLSKQPRCIELIMQTLRHFFTCWEEQLQTVDPLSRKTTEQYIYAYYQYQFRVLVMLTGVTSMESEYRAKWVDKVIQFMSEMGEKYAAVNDALIVQFVDTVMAYLMTIYTHCVLLYVQSLGTDSAIFTPLMYLHTMRLAVQYPGLHTLLCEYTVERQVLSSPNQTMYEYFFSILSPHTLSLHNLISFCTTEETLLASKPTDKLVREELTTDETTYLLQLFVQCDAFALATNKTKTASYFLCLKGCIMLLLYDFAPLPLPMLNEEDETWYISGEAEDSVVYWQQELIEYKQDLSRSLVPKSNNEEKHDDCIESLIEWNELEAFGYYLLAELQAHLTPHLLLSSIAHIQHATKIQFEHSHKQFYASKDASSAVCQVISQPLQWFGDQFFAIHAIHYQLLAQATNTPTILMHEQLMYTVSQLIESTKENIAKQWKGFKSDSDEERIADNRADMVEYLFSQMSLLQTYLLLAHEQGFYAIATIGYRFFLQQYHELSPYIGSEDSESYDVDLGDAWATWFGKVELGVSWQFAHTLVRLALSAAQLPIPSNGQILSSNAATTNTSFMKYQGRGKAHHIRTTQLFTKIFRDMQSTTTGYGTKSVHGKTIGGRMWSSTISRSTSSTANNAFIHEYDYYHAIQCLIHAGSLYEYQLQQLMLGGSMGNNNESRQVQVNLCGSFLLTVYSTLATIHSYQNQLILAQDCYEHMLKLFLQIPRLLDLSVLAQIQQHYGIWCIQHEGAEEIVGSCTAHGMVLMRYAHDYFAQAIEVGDKETETSTRIELTPKPIKEQYSSLWQEERIQNAMYQIMGCLQLHDYEGAQEKVNTTKELLFELYPKHTISVSVSLDAMDNNSASEEEETKGAHPASPTTTSGTSDMLPTHITTPINNPASVPEITTTIVDVIYHYDYAVLCFCQGLLHAHYEEYLDCLIQHQAVVEIYAILGLVPSSLECLQVFWQQSIVYHRMGLSVRAKQSMEEIVSVLLAIHGNCYPQILQVLKSLKELYADISHFPEMESIGEFITEVESRYYDKLAVQLAPYKQHELQYLDSIVPDLYSSQQMQQQGHQKRSSPPSDVWSTNLATHDIASNESDSSGDETEKVIINQPKGKRKKKLKAREDPVMAGYYFAYAIKRNPTAALPKATKKKFPSQLSQQRRTLMKKQSSGGTSTSTMSSFHHLAFDFEALSHSNTQDRSATNVTEQVSQTTTSAGLLSTRWQQVLQILPTTPKDTTVTSFSAQPSNNNTNNNGNNNNPHPPDRLQILQTLHHQSSSTSTSSGVVDEEIGKTPQKKSTTRSAETKEQDTDELPSGNGCIIM